MNQYKVLLSCLLFSLVFYYWQSSIVLLPVLLLLLSYSLLSKYCGITYLRIGANYIGIALIILLILLLSLALILRLKLFLVEQRSYSGIQIADISSFEAVLQDDPSLSSKAKQYYQARIIRVYDAKGSNYTAKLPVNIHADLNNDLPSWGSLIHVKSKLVSIDGRYFSFPNKSTVKIQKYKNNLFFIRSQLRQRIFKSLRGTIPGEYRPLFFALFFGVTDDLDASLKEQFRLAGCAYILALSGFHVGILVTVVMTLFRRLIGFYAVHILTILILSAYIFLIGFNPSLWRAVSMFILSTICKLYFKKANALNVLCISFFLQVLLFPAVTASMSFQLSYLALLGLIILTNRLSLVLSYVLHPQLAIPIAASLAAQIFSSLLLAGSFGVLQPIGLLVGIVENIAITIFMWLNILTLPLLYIDASSYIIGLLNKEFYRISILPVKFAAGAPSWRLDSPMDWTLLLLILLGLITWAFHNEFRTILAGRRT